MKVSKLYLPILILMISNNYLRNHYVLGLPDIVHLIVNCVLLLVLIVSGIWDKSLGLPEYQKDKGGWLTKFRFEWLFILIAVLFLLDSFGFLVISPYVFVSINFLVITAVIVGKIWNGTIRLPPYQQKKS